MRKLKESVCQHDSHLPLLTSKQLKGYTPDGRHIGIDSNKHPTRVDQFIEVKVIHNGCVHYGRPDVLDNPKEAAASHYYQNQVRSQYSNRLKRKNTAHCVTNSQSRGCWRPCLDKSISNPWFLVRLHIGVGKQRAGRPAKFRDKCKTSTR